MSPTIPVNIYTYININNIYNKIPRFMLRFLTFLCDPYVGSVFHEQSAGGLDLDGECCHHNDLMNGAQMHRPKTMI